MKKGKAELRQDRLLDMLENAEVVTTARMCETLAASESTIRNDLAKLEQEGRLIRVFGGAMKVEKMPSHLDLSNRETTHLAEKRKIAAYVLDKLIRPGDRIVLDAGSTNVELARAIATSGINLTVLTPSLKAAAVLSESELISLYVFGGFYNRQRGSLYDDTLNGNIETMRADCFFLGVDGVDLESGFTISGRSELPIKKAFMKIAAQTVALGGGSKMRQVNLRVVADFESVPTLVTDRAPEAGFAAQLQRKGLEILYPEGGE